MTSVFIKFYDIKGSNQIYELDNNIFFFPNILRYKTTKINDAQTISGNIHEGSWNTYHLPILRITVEHILSTKDITPIEYKQGKFFGSDHFPVFVEFSL